MLQDVDSKKNCSKEELGYAAMFQFYLDFFALAVTSTGIEGSQAYLIFVIFFTQVKFLENKIYTEKRQFYALNL